MFSAISKHGVSGIVKIEPEDDEIIFLSEPPPPQKKQPVEPVRDDTATAAAAASASAASAPVSASVVTNPPSAPASSRTASGSSSDASLPATNPRLPGRQAFRSEGPPPSLPSFQRRIGASAVSRLTPTRPDASAVTATGKPSVVDSSSDRAPRTRPVSLLSRIEPPVTLPIVHVPVPVAPRPTPVVPTVSSAPTTKKPLQRPLSPSSRPTDPRRAVRARQLANQASVAHSSRQISASASGHTSGPGSVPAPTAAAAVVPTATAPPPIAPPVQSALPVLQPAPLPLPQATASSQSNTIRPNPQPKPKPKPKPKPQPKATAKAVLLPPSSHAPSSSRHSNSPHPSPPMPTPTHPVDMSVFPNSDMTSYLHAFPTTPYDSYPYLGFSPPNQAIGTHSGSIASCDYYNAHPFSAPAPQCFAPPYMLDPNFNPVSQQQFGHPSFQSSLPSGQPVYHSYPVDPIPQHTFPSHANSSGPSSAPDQTKTTASRKSSQSKEPPLPSASVSVSHSSVHGSSHPSRSVQQPPVTLARPSAKDTQQPSAQVSVVQTTDPARLERTRPIVLEPTRIVAPNKPSSVPNAKSADAVVKGVSAEKAPVKDRQSNEYRVNKRTEPKRFAVPNNPQAVSGTKSNESSQVVLPSDLNSCSSYGSATTEGRLMAVDVPIGTSQKKLDVKERKPDIKLDFKPDLKPDSKPEFKPKLEPSTKPDVKSLLKTEGHPQPEVKNRKTLQERLAGEKKLAEANRSKSALSLPPSASQSRSDESPSRPLDKPTGKSRAISSNAATIPPSSHSATSAAVPTLSSLHAAHVGPSQNSRSDYRERSPLPPSIPPPPPLFPPPRREMRPYHDYFPSPSPPRRREYRRDWLPDSPPHMRRESIIDRGRDRSRSPMYDQYEPRSRVYRRSPSYSPSPSPPPPPPQSRMKRDLSPLRDFAWTSTRQSRSPVPYARRSPPRRSLVNRVAPINRNETRIVSPPRSRVRDDGSRVDMGVRTATSQTSSDSRSSQIPSSFRNENPDRSDYRTDLYNSLEFDERSRAKEVGRDWKFGRRREIERERARVAAIEKRDQRAREWAAEQRQQRQLRREREEARERSEAIELKRKKNQAQQTVPSSSASYPTDPDSTGRKVGLHQIDRPRPRLSEANATFCLPATGAKELPKSPVAAKPVESTPRQSYKASTAPSRPRPSEEKAEQGGLNLARVDPVDTASLPNSLSRQLELSGGSTIAVPPITRVSPVRDYPPPSDNQPEVDEVELLLDETDAWPVHPPISNDRNGDEEVYQRDVVSTNPFVPPALPSVRPSSRSSSEGLLIDSLYSATGEPIANFLPELSYSPPPEKKKNRKKKKAGTKASNKYRIGNDNPVGNNFNSNSNKPRSDQINQIYNNNNTGEKRLISNTTGTEPAIPARSSNTSFIAPLPSTSTSSTPPRVNTSAVTSFVNDETPTSSPRVNPLLVRLMSAEPVPPQRRSLLDRAGVSSTRDINEGPDGWASPSSLIGRLWNRGSR